MYTWLHSNPLTQPYNTFINGTNGHDGLPDIDTQHY